VNKSLPEIKHLRGVTWRYEGEDAADVFKRISAMRTMRSNYAPIVFAGMARMEKTDEEYRLFLNSGTSEMSIPVKPVIRSAVEKKSVQAKWDKYLAEIPRREKKEAEDFESFKKDSASFNRFFEEEYRPMTAQTVALRTFQMEGFGIWNCDRPFKPNTPNNVLAHFVDENGITLKVTTGYYVDKERNTVYALTNFQRFGFNPKSQNLFWAVLPDDKIAIVRPEEFIKNKDIKSGRCTFIARVSETALDSYSNLRSILQL
jgi:hypothetical protein